MPPIWVEISWPIWVPIWTATGCDHTDSGNIIFLVSPFDSLIWPNSTLLGDSFPAALMLSIEHVRDV